MVSKIYYALRWGVWRLQEPKPDACNGWPYLKWKSDWLARKPIR